jgi:predicted aconitase with swiveling domain
MNFRVSVALFGFVLVLPLCGVEPASLTVIDSAGKEVVVKTGRLTAGTRKLHWLEKDGKAPEALAFRETNSTGFKDGVLTFIPVERLEELHYDAAKMTVTAKVAGVENPLEGSTRYREINQIALVAEVDRGTAGVVELTYRGGPLKGGIQGLKFTGAKSAPALAGTPMFIQVSDGKQKFAAESVYDLRALYRLGKDGEKLAGHLMFRKTFKLELNQIKSLTVHENMETRNFECDITLKDGSEQTLTLLPSITLDGKNAVLEGLVGAVPAGFKLFPMHTIGALSVEEPPKYDPKLKEQNKAPLPKPKPPTP